MTCGADSEVSNVGYEAGSVSVTWTTASTRDRDTVGSRRGR
jgi:hypothetical protein